VAAPLSPSVSGLLSSLREVHAGGRTALYDAVFTSAALVSMRPGSTARGVQRWQDTMSVLEPAAVRQVVRGSNAVVYGVLTEVPEVRKDSLWLNDVARDTGGRVLVARSIERLTKVFLQVLAEFAAATCSRTRRRASAATTGGTRSTCRCGATGAR